MSRLELFVRFADGRGRVVGSERDDAEGRDLIDRMAFAFMARDDVETAEVQRERRTVRSAEIAQRPHLTLIQGGAR